LKTICSPWGKTLEGEREIPSREWGEIELGGGELKGRR